MSLKSQAVYTVPAETVRVAQAVFPQGNPYLTLYDTFGVLFEDEDFATLFARDGQPALSPVRLALVLVLQFMEGLSDRQAAEAVRSRIDWKYLLCLELTDPGFDHSVLSEFRDRLISGSVEELVLTKLLAHFRQHGLLQVRGQQRTDATHVLGAIRTLNRLEFVGETMRHALNTLAVMAPGWLQSHYLPEWLERYGDRVQEYRLPSSKTKREAYAQTIGRDGLSLLEAIDAAEAPDWLREVPALQTLRLVWFQQYSFPEVGVLCWRPDEELPPAHLRLENPYDPEVHYATKRHMHWIGYKVHLTETCDPDQPRLITHVETVPAWRQDNKSLPAIHQDLQEKELLPADHLVDKAYVDAVLLVESKRGFGVNLVGPTRPDTSWQARAKNNFTAHHFHIDWQRQQVTCPAGKHNQFWQPATDVHGREIIQVKFAKRDCRNCSYRTECTKANPPRRSIAILPELPHQALQAARQRQHTQAFKEQYSARAGIEGSISQAVRRTGMRQARYLGLKKTHLQHILTATALNLSRISRWLLGEPLAQTRRSAFLRLCQPVPSG